MSRAENLYYSPEVAKQYTLFEARARQQSLRQIPFGFRDNIAVARSFSQLKAAKSMITTPLFGAWLDRISQAVHNPLPSHSNTERAEVISNRINYIGNYAIAAALAGGEDTEVRIRAQDGHVMVPEFGRAALMGANSNVVLAQVSDGDIILTSPDTNGVVRIEHSMLDAPGPDWAPLRSVTAGDFTVPVNDIDPNRDIFRYPPAGRLTNGQYEEFCATFYDAWETLQKYYPHAAATMRHSLTTIVPAPPEPLTRGKSMAAGAAYGVVGVNGRDGMRMATQLLFGTWKHAFMALRHQRPHIHRSENSPLVSTPTYPPSREGYGIVPYLQDDSIMNIGLAHFYKGLLGDADPTIRAYGELSFARWYTEARQNVEALKDSGYVNRQNRRIFAALQADLEELASLFDTLPETVKQAIISYTLDRRLSWRLHTIIPDTHTVGYLRDRWLSGNTCPPITVQGKLCEDTTSYTHVGLRNRQSLAELRVKEPFLFNQMTAGVYDPTVLDELTAGDIAFANSNVREARNYFRAAIARQPSSAEAWAGFALSFEHEQSVAARTLLQHPELVAAVHAAIGGRTLEPEALAAWLAPALMAKLAQGA